MLFYVINFLFFRTRKNSHALYYSKMKLEMDSEKKNKLNEETAPSGHIFNCTDEDVIFMINSDNIRLYCDLDYEETFSYDQLSDVSIYLQYGQITFRVDEEPELPIDTIMKQLISDIKYTGPINAHFEQFTNYSSIYSYSQYFSSKYLQLWIKLEYYPKNCIWDYPTDVPDDLVAEGDQNNWFRTCRSNAGYLFYNTFNEPVKRKIVYLSLGTTIALIVIGVLLVIGVVVSLYFVSKWRYNKLTNESDKEDELSSS